MKLVKEKKSKVSLEDLPKSELLAKELKKVKYREQYLKTLKSTVFTLLSVAAVAVLIATIWLPVLQIYGKSMTPTLKSGDLVVSVNDKSFKQGDVIAFYYNNKVLVKRVIATSGQWVDIDDKGNVSVDGYLIDEPYLKEEDKAYGETNIELPYQVPDGKIFVMGDQRSVSIDSRNTAVGTVGDEQIVGRLTLRIWPLNRINWIK
jgi:signal peptidase I